MMVMHQFSFPSFDAADVRHAERTAADHGGSACRQRLWPEWWSAKRRCGLPAEPCHPVAICEVPRRNEVVDRPGWFPMRLDLS